MKTLYEQLKRSGVSAETLALLEGATIIQADNVADYFLAYKSDWGSAFDFPNVMPPFERVFIEFGLRGAADGLPEALRPVVETQRIGIYLRRFDLRAEDAPQVDADLEKHIHTAGMRWMVEARECNEIMGQVTLFNGNRPWLSKWIYGVTETGGIVTRPDGRPDIETVGTHMGDLRAAGLPTERSQTTDQMGLYVALLALSFLHCKNVTLEANVPLRQPGKRNRRAATKPAVTYHTIKIQAMTQQRGGTAGGQHAKPAVHIRRGHFKTYTDAAPLFGRLTGTYWWEAAAVGSGERRIEADYEVKPPKN